MPIPHSGTGLLRGAICYDSHSDIAQQASENPDSKETGNPMRRLHPGGEDNYYRFYHAHATCYMRDVMLAVCRESQEPEQHLSDDFVELEVVVPCRMEDIITDRPVTGKWLSAESLRWHQWDRSCAVVNLDVMEDYPDDIPLGIKLPYGADGTSLPRLQRIISDDLSHQNVSHRIVMMIPVDGDEGRRMPMVITKVDRTDEVTGRQTHLKLRLEAVAEFDMLADIFRPPYYGTAYV